LQVSELQWKEHCMPIAGLLTVLFNSATVKLLYWFTKHWARSWNLASVSALHQTSADPKSSYSRPAQTTVFGSVLLINTTVNSTAIYSVTTYFAHVVITVIAE
jgi:hypothetical protein